MKSPTKDINIQLHTEAPRGLSICLCKMKDLELRVIFFYNFSFSFRFFLFLSIGLLSSSEILEAQCVTQIKSELL